VKRNESIGNSSIPSENSISVNSKNISRDIVSITDLLNNTSSKLYSIFHGNSSNVSCNNYTNMIDILNQPLNTDGNLTGVTFTSTTGSKTVTVNKTSHGLSIGDLITFNTVQKIFLFPYMALITFVATKIIFLFTTVTFIAFITMNNISPILILTFVTFIAMN
jgi:hypothetical protein